MRSDGYASVQFNNLEDALKSEVPKLMDQAPVTDGKVELVTEESCRAMRLVLAESKKFAAKVAADKADMDVKAESFRTAGAGLEGSWARAWTRSRRHNSPPTPPT